MARYYVDIMLPQSYALGPSSHMFQKRIFLHVWEPKGGGHGGDSCPHTECRDAQGGCGAELSAAQVQPMPLWGALGLVLRAGCAQPKRKAYVSI